MAQEKLLHLIIIDKSMDDADLLASALRDAGHEIRDVFVHNESELHNALEEQKPDKVMNYNFSAEEQVED